MTTRDPKFSALFYLLALVILFANGESEARQENGRYGQTAGTLPPRSVQVYGETLPFRASSLDPAVKSILARLKLRRTADSRNEKYEDPKGSVELTFDGNHQLRSVSYSPDNRLWETSGTTSNTLARYRLSARHSH